jgi:amino acid transporter
MTTQTPPLRRELGTLAAIGLSIAMMGPTIAVALYGGAPAVFIGQAAPLAFVLAGVGVALVGGSLIYLSRHFSHAGSAYGLAGATLGPRAGFFSGWALLGTYLMYTPANAVTAGYFATLFCQDTGIWKGANYLTFTVVFLVLMFILASRDIKRVGHWLISLEGVSICVVTVVLVIIVAKLASGFDGRHLSAQVFVLPHGVPVHDLILASVFGFSAFAGFEGAASLGEETKNPRRAIPKALARVIVFAVVFYVVCCAIMAMGFGADTAGGKAFGASSGPLFQLAQLFVSKTTAEVLEIGAMLSAFSAGLGCYLASGRLIFALGRDARPNSRLARVGSSGAPTTALGIAIAVALIVNVGLRLLGNSGLNCAFYLGTIGTLSILVAYAMVSAGALRLMIRSRTVKLALLVPVLGLAILLYTLYNELHPVPPHPYNYFPYLVGAWLLIALVTVLFVPGLAKRVGQGLASAEGFGLGTPPVTASMDTPESAA